MDARPKRVRRVKDTELLTAMSPCEQAALNRAIKASLSESQPAHSGNSDDAGSQTLLQPGELLVSKSSLPLDPVRRNQQPQQHLHQHPQQLRQGPDAYAPRRFQQQHPQEQCSAFSPSCTEPIDDDHHDPHGEQELGMTSSSTADLCDIEQAMEGRASSHTVAPAAESSVEKKAHSTPAQRHRASRKPQSDVYQVDLSPTDFVSSLVQNAKLTALTQQGPVDSGQRLDAADEAVAQTAAPTTTTNRLPGMPHIHMKVEIPLSENETDSVSTLIGSSCSPQPQSHPQQQQQQQLTQQQRPAAAVRTHIKVEVPHGAPRPSVKRPKHVFPAFDLPEAPVYHPTAEEFENPMLYIASIRPEAEKAGICRIVPPEQWKPPIALNEATLKFNTRIQRLHQLQNRYPRCEKFRACLQKHLRKESIDCSEVPTLANRELDLYSLYKLVQKHGGLQRVIFANSWSKIADELHIPQTCPSREQRLQAFYYKYILSYAALSDDEKAAIDAEVCKERQMAAPETFGFDMGKVFTLSNFRRMADEMKEAWFHGKPAKPASIEREFWRIVESGDEYLSVNYGSDIDTTVHGSAFPVDSDNPYSKFGWNLNVLPGLPQSILKHIGGISGISMPWMYIGMLFSTFCWHVEDNFLYSINYMHLGAAKTWYGVPGHHARKFEEVFRQQNAELFASQPTLLHDLVTQISPGKLAAGGVSVCRTVQEAGEFVITFPRSYHAGFSHGFNCGEAVNFAAADWLPYGTHAMELYRLQKRPVTIDQEQLILQTAKNERNLQTLWHTLPELQRLHNNYIALYSRLKELVS